VNICHGWVLPPILDLSARRRQLEKYCREVLPLPPEVKIAYAVQCDLFARAFAVLALLVFFKMLPPGYSNSI